MRAEYDTRLEQNHYIKPLDALAHALYILLLHSRVSRARCNTSTQILILNRKRAVSPVRVSPVSLNQSLTREPDKG